MNESPLYSTQSPIKAKSSDKTFSEKRSSNEKKSSRTLITSPDKYPRTYEKQKQLSSGDSDSEHVKVSSKNLSKHNFSPVTRKSTNQSADSPQSSLKQKVSRRDRSRSSSVQSFQSNHDESQKSTKSWKSKSEIKDDRFKSPHKSPNFSAESLSRERKNTPQLVNLSPTHKKSPVLNDNPTSPPQSNITSPPNDSPEKVLELETEKKNHDSKSPELRNLSKNTAKKIQIHLKDKSSLQENEKISFNIKSVNISHQSENKAKFDDLNEDSEVKDTDTITSDFKNNKFGNPQNQSCELLLDSSNTKKEDKSSYTSMNFCKAKTTLSNKSRHERKRRSETPESTHSRSRSISQNPDFNKDKENKKRISKISHSRSRSSSAARSSSTSASDRSSRSRSRSYSNRRSKSYSKSRSKSFSKSPSHSKSKSRSKSKSWSKSISKSRSKSFSRSRSKSYSRSRSRSISIYSR